MISKYTYSRGVMLPIVAVAILFMVGIGGLFLFRSEMPLQQSSPSPTFNSISNTPNPTSDFSSVPTSLAPNLVPNGTNVPSNWETYNFSGLTFKYPPTFQGYNLKFIEIAAAFYPDMTSGYLNASNPTEPEGTDNDVGFVITRLENPENLSTADWWSKNIAKRELVINNVKEQDYALQNVTIGSFTFLSYKHKFVLDQGYIYKGKNGIYIFSEQISASNPTFTKSLLDQILSTFEFLDEDLDVDTSGWKTHQNTKLGFTVSLPPEFNAYTTFDGIGGIERVDFAISEPVSLNKYWFWVSLVSNVDRLTASESTDNYLNAKATLGGDESISVKDKLESGNNFIRNELEVSGREAVSLHPILSATDTKLVTVATSEKIYSIALQAGSEPYLSKEALNVFDQILSTFEFLE